MDFSLLFHTDLPARDKFLSRVFGVFSEEIVRCWAADSRAPFEDLGRPSLKNASGKYTGTTLDFTFRNRADRKVYIVEMKCEMEYEKYRYLTLETPSQLEHHLRDSKAFKRFCEMAEDTSSYNVTIQGQLQPIDGAMLIWGRSTEQGRDDVMNHYGFADVLSAESIVADLVAWDNQAYKNLISQRKQWCEALFSGLLS